jgi:hypothetical protein
LQKIGLNSGVSHSQKSVQDLSEDYQHLVDELNMTTSFLTRQDEDLMSMLRLTCNRLLKNSTIDISYIVLYAMIFFTKKHEGL